MRPGSAPRGCSDRIAIVEIANIEIANIEIANIETASVEYAMADWPLTADLGPLGALPTAPRLARGFIGAVLNSWGLEALIDDAELLASELTTNVVRASTNPDGSPMYDDEGKLPVLWVRLLSDGYQLMIEIWDTLPVVLGAPVVRHPDPDEESGRGLEMIDALAEDWGWESVPGWAGKRVWAVLTISGGDSPGASFLA